MKYEKRENKPPLKISTFTVYTSTAHIPEPDPVLSLANALLSGTADKCMAMYIERVHTVTYIHSLDELMQLYHYANVLTHKHCTY